MMQPPGTYIQPRGQSAALAAVASFFIPGLGQIILGQTMKGIVVLGGSFMLGWLCGLANILAAIDAWIIGQKLGKGQAVEEWEVF